MDCFPGSDDYCTLVRPTEVSSKAHTEIVDAVFSRKLISNYGYAIMLD